METNKLKIEIINDVHGCILYEHQADGHVQVDKYADWNSLLDDVTSILKSWQQKGESLGCLQDDDE